MRIAEVEPSAVAVRQDGDLAWVTIDHPPVNATSAAVRRGLAEAVRDVSKMPVRAAVLRCAGRTFVAGGDITEFDAPPIPPDLPDVIRDIEDCPVPWIAAMHGTVFGGGLEIALGCAWRVARPDTRFALPEVRLGLVPGAGGTQRLPRLVGADLAVDMTTKGASVSADAFQQARGLDAVLPELTDAALRAFAAGAGERPQATRLRQASPQTEAWWAEREDGLTDRIGGPIAPGANLALVRRASMVPFDTGQPEERARHLELRETDASRALRHIFFAERRAARHQLLAGVKAAPVDRVEISGDNPLAGDLYSMTEDAGIAVARSSANTSDCEFRLVVNGADTGTDLSGDGVVKAHAVPIEAGRARPVHPAGARIALGFTPPPETKLVEIALFGDVSPAAGATALGFARRLGAVPVVTTPAGALATQRLQDALARFRAQSDPAPEDGWGGAVLRQFGTRPVSDISSQARGALAVLVNEGALAVEEGCVSGPGSIDVLAVAGCGVPRWLGGPMYLAERIDVARVAGWMEVVMSNAPEAWSMSRMLRSAAA